MDPERVAALDWSRPITEETFTSDRSLLANRLLMNVYESDALFLPAAGLRKFEADFHAFYHSDSRRAGDLIRPETERFAFGFLDDTVSVSGQWDEETLRAHLRHAVDRANSPAVRPAFEAIRAAKNPKVAAGSQIVQMALDGLTEATAMSQNLGGAFGPEQSELFKIFVDEFGYGVFPAKHSTLFMDLCSSVGMATTSHHYWFFYLPSSIAINNYFYWATRNRTGFFRYIGAMAFLEATFAAWFGDLTKVFRDVYGDTVDTRYCDEHAHIDQHHGRMAIDDLLIPLARKHGPVAVKGLLQGVEEIQYLDRLAGADLLRQITWDPALSGTPEDAPAGAVGELDANSAFDTQVAAVDTRLRVLSGEALLYHSATDDPLRVPQGSSVLVPAGRLYGVRAESRAEIATGPEA
ncbi:iron-containing redox enzyme family protein [Streptomyces paludis]|uniref:Iron-containing redox enzyme family protein n=1 Tax=Streptomyces paludis TaxID=2282738 RepID=A0A345HLW8_9ACTN|nr:iron-containing redox enzyme family protein [Streptomyces paludis]AXG77692.1 iron-containing redox enzyme family protein [Streptomyces paludis]